MVASCDLQKASSVTKWVTEKMLQCGYVGGMSQSQPKSVAPTRPMNRIRELRLARKWSMEDLAARCGTDRQRIYQLEHGNARLNEDWMRRIASAFRTGSRLCAGRL
jgi:DNA-binding XRE family transcriptional regulator